MRHRWHSRHNTTQHACRSMPRFCPIIFIHRRHSFPSTIIRVCSWPQQLNRHPMLTSLLNRFNKQTALPLSSIHPYIQFYLALIYVIHKYIHSKSNNNTHSLLHLLGGVSLYYIYLLMYLHVRKVATYDI